MQRCCREKNLSPVRRCFTDGLSKTTALAVSVAELVSFINDNEVPFDRANHVSTRSRVVERSDNYGCLTKRIWNTRFL